MTSKRVIIWQTILIIKITQTECSKSQIVTLNAGRGQNIKKLPYAFTEQGVAMLSSVLLFCHIHWASEDTPFFLSPSPSNIFQKFLASFRRKTYLCSRNAALGNQKARFLCSRLHNLCSTKVESLKQGGKYDRTKR